MMEILVSSTEIVPIYNWVELREQCEAVFELSQNFLDVWEHSKNAVAVIQAFIIIMKAQSLEMSSQRATSMA